MKALFIFAPLLVWIALNVQADESRPDRHAFHEALKKCAESAGVQRPEKGSRPPELSDEARSKIDACLKEAGFERPVHPRGKKW